MALVSEQLFRLRASVWLGRTWGYVPLHPTQFMWEVKELEWPDVGFPAARILHMQQEQEQIASLELSCRIAAVEGRGKGKIECNDK